MLDRYFTLEDPTRLEPRHRELSVEAVLESGLMLRGYIDRLDVAPDGEIRIVDYKTGTAPQEEYEAQALFQMKFYAVVLWRTERRIPTLLQLIYLGNGEIVRFAPDESDLLRHGAEDRRAVAGHRAGPGDRRLAAAAEQALRLVRAPGDLPGLRRHSPAAPGEPAGNHGRRAAPGRDPAPAAAGRCAPATRGPP